MVSYVDNKTGVRVKPPKNPVFSDAILWFTDALGSTPTIPQADWFNMIQAELLGMAEAFGITPDKLDDGQLGVALKEAFQGVIDGMPVVLDKLGESRVAAGSQRIINVVNQLAKDAMQSALLANDKANQAKQEAYEAKQIAQKGLSLAEDVDEFSREIDFGLLANMSLVSSALNRLEKRQPLSILCLGDSMTYGHDIVSADKQPPLEGHSTTRAKIQYPIALESELKRIYNNQNITTINYGRSGATARSSFYDESFSINPGCDLAFIMFGINEANGNIEVNTYIEYLYKWIKRLNSWGTGVVILGIPRTSRGSIGNVYNNLTHAVRSLSASINTPYLDVNNFTNNYSVDDIFSDATHYNSRGYQLLGYEIAWATASRFASGKISNSTRIIPTELNSVTDGVRIIYPSGESLNKRAVRLNSANTQKLTFPFFLDADDAYVTFIGDIRANVKISIDSDALRSSSYFQASKYETTKSYMTDKHINPKVYGEGYIARVVGRGWHCVTLENTMDSVNTFIESINIKVANSSEGAGGDLSVLYKNTSLILFPKPTYELPYPPRNSETEVIIGNEILRSFVTYSDVYYESLPLKITIIDESQAPPSFTSSFSECFIVKAQGGKYNVLQGHKSSDEASTVIDIEVDFSSEEGSKLILNRPKSGWLKIFIEAHSSPFFGGFLKQR